MRQFAPTVAVAVATAFVLGACAAAPGDSGATPDGSAPVAITVGVIPIVDAAPLYIAEEQGFFEDAGLDVTLEPAQGGAAIIPAIVGGDVQFGYTNNTSLLLAVSNGIPLKAVAPGTYSTGTAPDFAAVVVPEGSPITSARDLEGATVAVNTLNNIGDSTVRAAVEEDGGDPAAVDFVEIGFPDMPAAIAGGHVDAAWINEPYLTRALEQGAQVISWNWLETNPDLMIASYVTTQQYAADNPEVVAAFNDALDAAIAYIADDPDAIRDILDVYTDIDDATKQAMTLPRLSTQYSAESLDWLAELALRYGMVTDEIDYDDVLP